MCRLVSSEREKGDVNVIHTHVVMTDAAFCQHLSSLLLPFCSTVENVYVFIGPKTVSVIFLFISSITFN